MQKHVSTLHEQQITDLAQQAEIDEHYLLDRENGERMLPVLREHLNNISLGEPLILCFAPQTRTDASFADAAFVSLALEVVEGKFGDRAVLLKDLSPNLIFNIEGAIEKRDLKLAMLAVFSDGTWSCIGHLEQNLRDTLNEVAEHDGLGASDLVTLFDLAINTASNRLKKLHDQHLVRRQAQSTEKGLQFTYYFWKWTE